MKTYILQASEKATKEKKALPKDSKEAFKKGFIEGMEQYIKGLKMQDLKQDDEYPHDFYKDGKFVFSFNFSKSITEEQQIEIINSLMKNNN